MAHGEVGANSKQLLEVVASQVCIDVETLTLDAKGIEQRRTHDDAADYDEVLFNGAG